MRHQFQCRACDGTYFEMLQDGGPYAHVCGPLPPDKNGVQAERPDKRDENMVVNGAGKLSGIRSEGAGVTCLTDGRLEEPRWISTLHKRIAKEEGNEDA